MVEVAKTYAKNLKKVLVPSNDFAGFIGNGHFMRDALHGIHEVERLAKEMPFVEALYITDRLIDNGTKGVDKMYPVLAIHNYSQSPNIQTFLAGIYRKTQVPDAFGPLLAMLIRNSMKESSSAAKQLSISIYSTAPTFDPNEEIGGAILEYISNYSKNSKPINYNA